MSLSNPVANSVNPAKKFIEFRGGEFRYYDKQNKEYVKIELPITFTVLDELSTITGFDEKNQCGIYSNEVWSIQKTKLVVKSFKGGDIAEGFYSEIKDKVKARGGKYAKSVYAYFNGEIVNFKFQGAALSPWIEKTFNVLDKSVKIEKLGNGSKGATKYKFPIFEGVKMEDREESTAADKELQIYLKEKIVSPKTNPVDEFTEEPPTVTEEDWD